MQQEHNNTAMRSRTCPWRMQAGMADISAKPDYEFLQDALTQKDHGK